MGFFIIAGEDKESYNYKIKRKNWILYLVLLAASGAMVFYFNAVRQSQSGIVLIIFLIVASVGLIESLPMIYRAIAAQLSGRQIMSKNTGTIFHKNFESEVKIKK